MKSTNNRFTNRIILFILIFHFPILSFALTYYVSNTGNDANSGLNASLPWKTIAKVNAHTFVAGDQILFMRGDTWREKLTVPSSGSSTSSILFSNYGSGANPRILGSDQATSWTNQGGNIWKSATSLIKPWDNSGGRTANVFFVNTDLSIGTGTLKNSTSELTADYNWYWEANSIYVYCSSNPATRYASVEVAQRNYCVAVNRNNYIEINGINAFYSTEAGIHDGQSTTTVQNGMTVRNCESAWHGYPDGGGYGISVTVSNSLVENNVIHDCGRRSVSIGLWSNVTVSNIVIQNNTFYNGYHTLSVDIQADMGAGVIDGVYIRKNLIYESPSYNPPSNPMMMYLSQQSASAATIRNIYITDNVFKYPSNPGIQIDKITGVFIYNNTFYGHTEVAGKESNFLYVTNGTTNMKVKNNIFYSQLTYDTNDAGVAFYLTSTQPSANIESDYNIYYRTSKALLLIKNDSPYARYKGTDFSTIRSVYGWETHSQFINPQLVSSTDYRLQSNSPAINKGVDVGLTSDFMGNPIDKLLDIGAFEYCNIIDINVQ